MLLATIGCLLLAGLTLPGCATGVNQMVALRISRMVDGSVTEPGQGTFTYDAAPLIDLVVEAQAGSQFVECTGDVDTAAGIKAASTAITFWG